MMAGGSHTVTQREEAVVQAVLRVVRVVRICSDEGLTFETSAFESLYGG